MNEVIPSSLAGERLDRVVAVITELPRSVVSAMLSDGNVRLDDHVVTKGSQRVTEGQRLEVDPQSSRDRLPEAEEGVEFDVVYVDDDIIVVDKPAGLVVHPGAAHESATLVNGLLSRFPDMALHRPGDPARPGIVHRLDAGTSGLLVVARTQASYESLVGAMKARRVERRYLGLAWGAIEPTRGMIDAPIGRGDTNRTKMAISVEGKEARTRYEVKARHVDPDLSLVMAELETGRTHQIRVHLSSIGHPLVGDARYGGARQSLAMDRPFLHAFSLRFRHPCTEEDLYFEAPIPSDLAGVLQELHLQVS